MKNRRWIASLLAVCMLVCMLPASAFAQEGVAPAAVETGSETYTNGGDTKPVDLDTEPQPAAVEDPVARVGETEYDTLQAAIAAAGADDTVELLQNVETAESIIVKAPLKLDLGGHTLTTTSTAATGAITVANGTTVISNGTIASPYIGVYVQNPGAFELAADASISLSGTAKGTGIFIQNFEQLGNVGTVVTVRGEISGSANSAIQGNGGHKTVVGTINIESTADISGGDVAIYHPQNGILNIKGGKVVGNGGSAIAIKAGELNITGGTIRCTGAYTAPTEPFGNGALASGAAIQIETNESYAGNITVNISGDETKIISDHGNAIYQYGQENQAAQLKSVTITGGTFTSGEGIAAVATEEAVVTDKKVAISNGTFSTNVNDYCVEGFGTKENSDGTYDVVDARVYVAQAGQEKFETLQAAINAAGDQAVVTLLADVTESVTVPADKNITLDLAGKTLTGVKNAKGEMVNVITNCGILTIRDSAGNGTVLGGADTGDVDGKAGPGRKGIALVNEIGATCTVESGTIKRGDDDTFGNYTVQNKGMMYIKGGLITNNSNRSNLLINYNNQGSSNFGAVEGVYMEISGGTVSQRSMSAIKNDPGCTMKITGTATVIERTMGQANYNYASNLYGTVTIDGGTITTDGVLGFFSWKNTNGQEFPGSFTVTGDAKLVCNEIRVVNQIAGEQTSQPPVLTISGDADVTANQIYQLLSNKVTTDDISNVDISGGTFSKDVTKYCVAGKVAFVNEEDGKYHIYDADQLRGEVAPIGTDATVSGRDTVTVTFDENSTLYFTAEGNGTGEAPDRAPNMWWAGVRVTAPDQVRDSAKYQKVEQWWLDDGSADFGPASTPWMDNDGTFWVPVCQEYFNRYARNGVLTYRYRFDWDGNGVYEQNVTIQVKNTVTLNTDNVAATTGGRGYSTLEAAIAAASANGSVELLQSVTLGGTLVIGKPVTLLGNGKTVTANGVQITNNADLQNLTVEGGGVTVSGQSANNVRLENVTVAVTGDALMVRDGANVIARGMETAGDGEGTVYVDPDSYFTLQNGSRSGNLKEVRTDGIASHITITLPGWNNYKAGENIFYAAGLFINLTPDDVSLLVAETKELVLEGAPAGAEVTWTTGNPAVATVDNGVVTAVGDGETEITVTVGSMWAQCTVTVTGAALTLSQTTLSMTVGHTVSDPVTLTATTNITGAEVTWTSSDETVATVVNGLVTPVGAGTATITAAAGDLTATCEVTVTNTVAPTLTLSQTTLSMTVGYTVSTPVTLTATATPAGTVTWTSSNTAVATVNDSGLVTPVAAGTATITATANGVTATCEVTVTSTSAPSGGGSGGGGGGGGGSTTPAPTPTPTPPAEEDLGENDTPLTEKPLLFEDVAETDWFHGAVSYVFGRDMMKGVEELRFAPQLTTTRAMIVTILYRLEKEPEAEASAFTDVARNTWYTKAVDWAAANGIVKGFEDNSFRPEELVTREQLAAILGRYATFKGYDKTLAGDMSYYNDRTLIASWAREEMTWAVGAKILRGKGNNLLDPQGSASRAEAAEMLKNFCQAFERETKTTT